MTNLRKLDKIGVQSQKMVENPKKPSANTGRTPVVRGGSTAKAPALAARPCLRGQGWELALAYTIRIHLETGPRRVAEANAGTQEQGREIRSHTCGKFTWRQGRGGSQKRSQAQRKFIVGEG